MKNPLTAKPFSCICCLLLNSTSASKAGIDPTGSYKLVSNAKEKDGEIYGCYGTLKMKLIGQTRVIVGFNISKGYPSYNSGSFLDTLDYRNNTAVYKDAFDTTCRLTLRVSPKGVTVTEKTADYNFGCGFGHGIVANGFFKKVSSAVPVIMNN